MTATKKSVVIAIVIILTINYALFAGLNVAWQISTERPIANFEITKNILSVQEKLPWLPWFYGKPGESVFIEWFHWDIELYSPIKVYIIELPNDDKLSEETYSSVSPTRIHRPEQLDPEDVKIGNILLEFGQHRSNKLLVVKPPYNVGSDCMFDYVWWENGKPWGSFIWTGYCSDHGLVPYDNHMWNRHNYMTRSEEPPLRPQEVQEAIKDIRPDPFKKEQKNDVFNEIEL